MTSGARQFSKTVHGSVDNGVLLVVIDNPPVNAASTDVRKGLLAALKHAADTAGITTIVLTGKGANFVAGADIREMDGPLVEPVLPVIIETIDSAQKPAIAAINGTALGGGLEIALACHTRLASPSARLGLPEVKLGIVPGAGGTQRLPRLTGTETAARMIAGGQIIDAGEAARFGIVDRVVGDRLIAEAMAAGRLLAASGKWQRTGNRAAPALDEARLDAAVRPLLAKARGIPAVAEAIRLVKLSASMPFAEAMAEERRTFLSLRDSSEAAALRHIFFAERSAARVAEIEGVDPTPLHSAGVAGIGLMGAGIAVALLNAGLEVTAIDSTPEATALGQKRIEEILQKSVASGRMTDTQRADRLRRLTIGTEIGRLASAGLVIEAVPDDLAIKQDLFRRVEAVLPGDAILATNTSYLDPLEIFERIANPGRCIGLHFFSPAHVMRLVEVVKCRQTSGKTLATAIALCRRIGKLPVVCEACEGFVGNRLFSAYRRQAEFLVEEGATPKQVDAAMEKFGMALGPFAVFDMTGLEIAWARRKRQAASRNPLDRYVPIADWLCESGRFGRKTGRGWYDYAAGEAKEYPDILAMVELASRQRGIARRSLADKEIVDRLVGAMANEGARLLGEAIVPRASDIDLVLVNGYGFPAHRGGAMFWADRHGLTVLVKEIEKRHALDGPGSAPAALLAKLARADASLARWQAERKAR